MNEDKNEILTEKVKPDLHIWILEREKAYLALIKVQTQEEIIVNECITSNDQKSNQLNTKVIVSSKDHENRTTKDENLSVSSRRLLIHQPERVPNLCTETQIQQKDMKHHLPWFTISHLRDVDKEEVMPAGIFQVNRY
jgi:hypothetical protein